MNNDKKGVQAYGNLTEKDNAFIKRIAPQYSDVTEQQITKLISNYKRDRGIE